jgi:predicted RNA-binding Zn-ribbon protein involved in translation (DUF1610 family)
MSKPLLLLDVCCPNCQASLTQGQEVVLHAHVAEPRQEGEVHLSALFGDYSHTTDLAISDGTVVEFLCPSCERSIMVETACRLCGAPLASLNLASGGSLEFCARRGCRGHALGGFGELDDMIELLNRMFKIPHD